MEPPVTVLQRGLHFHTMTLVRTELRFLAGAKFAYIRLNMSTPCPPRSAVPVNRPFSTASAGDGPLFGFEFGQACDPSNDVRQTVSLFTIALPAAIMHTGHAGRKIDFTYALSQRRRHSSARIAQLDSRGKGFIRRIKSPFSKSFFPTCLELVGGNIQGDASSFVAYEYDRLNRVTNITNSLSSVYSVVNNYQHDAVATLRMLAPPWALCHFRRGINRTPILFFL